MSYLKCVLKPEFWFMISYVKILMFASTTLQFSFAVYLHALRERLNNEVYAWREMNRLKLPSLVNQLQARYDF